ncbi:MAG TPA: RsmB/NOP family class I SAM-dependent RNA methyltransferase [Candidatus Bathyarchaeia archaeon]|nr:RsmB/NOP family class I SAM-dependent RNA methyltransferase [Candidatus Bathyarchaeia archaeon]
MVCPKNGKIIAAYQHQLFMIRHPNLLLMSGKEYFLDRYEQLGWKYSEIKLRQSIRINDTNADEKNIVARLKSRGAELEKIPFLKNGYWIKAAKFSMGITSEYLLGLFSIQEAAAQIPATLFTDLKDKLVLDACAAPGGKTVQLADLMYNTGAVIALDSEKRRLTALSNHLERCRVKNTIVYIIDARQASGLNLKFDRILLDVPCSGNFAADSLWFNRRNMEDVERNAKLQKEILTEATRILKDDGEIVYSTCSLEPEEDELNINWAIRNLNLQVETIDCYGYEALTNVFGQQLDRSISKCRRIWPGQTQGFFASKLKRA